MQPMDITLRTIEDLSEALTMAEELEELAIEQTGELDLNPSAAGFVRRTLEKSFETPECLLMVATLPGESERLGLLFTVGLEDPLTAARIPLVCVVEVVRKWRRRGLAREMVKSAREILRARGQERIAVRAGHNDDVIISMGERWGFIRHWELMLSE